MKPLSLFLCLWLFLTAIPSICAASSDAALVERGWRLAADLRFDDALRCFRPVARRFSSAQSTADKAVCLDAIYGCIDANIHKSNFMAAYDDLLTAQDIISSEKLPDAKFHLNMGRIYMVLATQTPKMELMRNAFDHSQRSFYSAMNSHDDATVFEAFCNMVTICYVLSDFEQLHSELAIMKKREAAGDWRIRYALECYYARSAAASERNAEARLHYKTALALLPDVRSTVRMKASKLKNIALVDIQDNKPDSALARLPEALALAEKYQQSDIIYNVYKLLEMAYEQKGDSAMTLRYANLAMHLKDSLHSFAVTDNLSQLEFFRERRHLTDRLATASMRQQIWLWGFIAALFVAASVVAVALVLRAKNRRLRRHAAKIYSQLREKYLYNNSSAHQHFPDIDEDKQEQTVKYERSSLSDVDKQQICARIDEVMATDIIFRTDLSLNSFAVEVGRHPKAVSQVIHELKGSNFSTLVNRARIVEAIRRLDMPEYAHLSTEAIAESVGFASRNTFGLNFKKFTGLSLREYRKAAKDVDNI